MVLALAAHCYKQEYSMCHTLKATETLTQLFWLLTFDLMRHVTYGTVSTTVTTKGSKGNSPLIKLNLPNLLFHFLLQIARRSFLSTNCKCRKWGRANGGKSMEAEMCSVVKGQDLILASLKRSWITVSATPKYQYSYGHQEADLLTEVENLHTITCVNIHTNVPLMHRL